MFGSEMFRVILRTRPKGRDHLSAPVPRVRNKDLTRACCLLSQLAVHVPPGMQERAFHLSGPPPNRAPGSSGRVWAGAHLAAAGFPLPAQVSGLLPQPLRLLCVGRGRLFQLGPQVPQLRGQAVHGALGQTAPQRVLCPLRQHPTFRSAHGPSRWPARPSVTPRCLKSAVCIPRPLRQGFPRAEPGLPRRRGLRRRPAYPVLLLPALSISLLSLHLQGDGGQAVLCAHQFL